MLAEYARYGVGVGTPLGDINPIPFDEWLDHAVVFPWSPPPGFSTGAVSVVLAEELDASEPKVEVDPGEVIVDFGGGTPMDVRGLQLLRAGMAARAARLLDGQSLTVVATRLPPVGGA